MLRNAIWIMFFGLIVAGCASDKKVESVESSGGTSSTAGGGAAASSPAMSGAASSEPKPMNQPNSSRNRIAAEVEEETLKTCLARIPQDATPGQKMMAEQTCQRNYPSRR